jgi:hypothetical protein
MTTIHSAPERQTDAASVVHTAQGAVRGVWKKDVAVFARCNGLVETTAR